MEKRTHKRTEKRAEKDMKRTEFAQEYNFNTDKQSTTKSDKTNKTNRMCK